MNLSISFEPLFSWPVLTAAALALLALALFGLFRRARGAWLRLAAAAALILALANPVFLSEDRDPVKSVVALISDRSQSQSLGERTADTDKAIAAVRERLGRFKQFELREFDAGKGGSAEERASTRLFAALTDIFRDVPPSRIAGAIMVTDGQVHDVPKDMAALGFDAPVHALITGKDKEFDRSVRFTQSPRFGLAGKPSQMEFLVSDEGPSSVSPGATVRVFVNGEQVAQQAAQVGSKVAIEVPLGRAGANIIELATDVLPGETSESNNRAVATVDAIRENLRVLLVSGEPHAGERTWRNLLKSDASVDLVHFTILRPPEKQDGTPINELSLIAFPTRELFVERIKDFDLIIFDRYQHRDVLPTLYYDYIAQYVEQGGALLVAAGPEYAGEATIANTPLASALPALPTGDVTEEGFLPELTELGKRHPVTRGLEGSETSPPAWSRWFRLISVTPPDGETVMKGAGDQPLLVLNRKGEGRVGMFLSDQGWLWARGFEGGGPHVSLYRRIAHWLMKEPELEEEALSAAAKGQTLEVTRQTMADEGGKAEVILPSGKTATIALVKTGDGLFSGKLDTEEVGLFRIANGDLTTLVHVGPVNAPEFLSTVSTLAPLTPLVKQSGGAVLRLADTAIPDILPVRGKAEAGNGHWLGLKTTDETILRSVSRLPLFAGLLGLSLLLLALGSVWYREGR
jgi:Putative glutamine amidotransferase